MHCKRLIASALAIALVATGCTTDPKTGSSTLNKAALYGIGGALACGAIGATRSGKDARNAALACGAVGAGIGGYMDYQETKLREQLAQTQIGVQRIGDQIRLTLPDNISFDIDKSEVKPGARAALANVGSIMVQYPATTIAVIGHTDNTGTAAHNQQLSERRAEAVTTVLASSGVDSVRIRTMGVGMSQPVASNATAVGRARNRRVEILIDPVRQ
ncbi:OmpA family protein [Paludibacterium yongneupense]|uniref:OmpA family protein n=1 Tax=Paludibacterium yongneupense TaxID=400061 RepID=UPI00040E437E|nr:OmpA family protein [Paludibacterium yongneupense]